MVNMPPPARAGPRRLAATPLRLLFMLLVGTALVAGVCGGLLRAGVAWPDGGAWLGRAALMHAALMIGVFLGTVIAIERAVALRHRAAFLGPALSALAGPLLLAGAEAAGTAALLAASALFVGVNVALLRRQRAAHTALLLLGALAWCAGNAAFVLGLRGEAVLAAWFAFLVLTIAAERLEMTRLMRHRPGAQALLFAALGLLLGGAALSGALPAAGGVLYGVALLALAAWLGRYDIARRTLAAHGLSRYMAVCLLSGYAWLGVAGIAWAATALGWPARDAALHALGLGFVVAMMMGHAPVILPAVARIKLQFGGFFYAPLALLHASLLLRLAGAVVDPPLRAAGAVLNAVALLLFVATVVIAALSWRRGHATAAPRLEAERQA